MALLSPLQRLTDNPTYGQYALPLSPGVFHLGYRSPGNDRPISIPSQIELASEFVLLALVLKVVTPDLPLLVFGAGATGVAAAITAAESGVPVTVREKKGIAFAPQAGCATRWLHPYQYEWPAPHYRFPRFPRVRYAPLHWSAGYAREVADQWQEQFDDALRDYAGLLEYAPNSQPVVLRRPDRASADLPEAERKEQYIRRYREFIEAEDPDEDFGLYLICTGFGEEQCSLGDFCGFPFWSNDPIDEPDFGAGVEKERPRVLISGGGDGAQQDLLRFAFAQPPLVILDQLLEGNDPAWKEWRSSTEERICDLQRLPPTLRRNAELVSDCYASIMDDIPVDIWSELKRRIEGMLRLEFRDLAMTVAFRDGSLPLSFPLNRFLVLLLRRFVQETYGRDLFLPLTAVSEPVATDGEHVCCRKPRECWAQPHQPHMNDVPALHSYDIMLVRHGLG